MTGRSRTLAAALLAAGVVAAPVVVTSSAAASDTVFVPPSGTMTVLGHGWGHGHGMSQWGAQGAARQGLSAAQILSFYYPGTAGAVLSNTAIRVLITERTSHLLFASARPGLQLRDANGTLTTLDPSVPFWRLAYTSTSGYLLQRLSGTTWATVRTSPTPLGFVGSSSVREWQAWGSTVDFGNIPSRDYRGELRLIWDGSTTNTINVVPMESYLRGVVPRESPSSFPAAALQAQSVAARSYSANRRAYWASRRSFDVYDTTSDQVYGGAAYYPTASSSPTPLEAPSTDAAIAATAGQVRTYGGQVILAQFSSSNGGFTSAGGEPYLVAKPDPYEKYSDNPYLNWTTSVSVSSLRAWSGLATLSWLYVHRETAAGGHVATVDLVGTNSAGQRTTVTRTGNDFRLHFGWRSTYFEFVSTRRQTTSDFNNDGRSDPTVFRPSTGTWYVHGVLTVQYGQDGDIPLNGDFTGDGATDIALFRPATGEWAFRGYPSVQYGQTGDIPLAADFTGDGRADVALFRPSTGTWAFRGYPSVQYGQAGDIPLPADYDGDGRADIALFRPSTGTWAFRGRPSVQYGQAGDIPLLADFTGDGRADIALFRPSTGTWAFRGYASVTWGQPGDVPVPIDSDGNGRGDIAVWRPSTGVWWFHDRPTLTWGVSGDIPLRP